MSMTEQEYILVKNKTAITNAIACINLVEVNHEFMKSNDYYGMTEQQYKDVSLILSEARLKLSDLIVIEEEKFRQEEKTCQTCDGEGKLKLGWAGEPDGYTEKCADCNGTGKT